LYAVTNLPETKGNSIQVRQITMRGSVTGLLQFFAANEEMVWRCLKAAVIAAASIVASVAVFWTATMSAAVPAAELVKYTPDVGNGMEISNVGGCASCHASPNQDPRIVDRTRLGGGLPLKSPFGTFYVPNISMASASGVKRISSPLFGKERRQADITCSRRFRTPLIDS
jgi:hypothetical protein